MTRRTLFTLPFAGSASAQPDPDLIEVRALIARNRKLQRELDASIDKLKERVVALERWGPGWKK